MSRKPNEESVRQLKQVLRDYRFTVKRLAELRRLTEEIASLEEQAKSQHQSVIQLLEEMDVKANGNFGWEGRVMAFLLELDRQSGSDPI